MPWAVVQHSGYGYGHKANFCRGLEERQLTTDRQIDKVEREGGIIFETYKEASTFCEDECYPEGYGGMLPRAPGSFSSKKIDGLAIYRPKKGE